MPVSMSRTTVAWSTTSTDLASGFNSRRTRDRLLRGGHRSDSANPICPPSPLSEPSPSSGAQAGFVRRDHLPHERQESRQRVFSREAAVLDSLMQEVVKSRHVRGRVGLGNRQED